MLEWLKFGLEKTSKKIVSGIGSILKSKKLDKEALSSLEDILVMADVGYETSCSLINKLAKKRYDKEVNEAEIREILSEDIAEILKTCEGKLDLSKLPKPFVILMVGVNGSGKTTTIGKLARYFSDNELTVSMVAGDTFRAAAVEQLSIWAKRTKAIFFRAKTGADASGLVFDSITNAIIEKHDVILIDTAGRLQNRKDLMAELQKIIRVIKKVMPEAPHLVMQVIDATVGQNAHSQIQTFKDMVEVNGLVITKLDGTAKGGVIVSISEKQKVPIFFIGAGEKITDMKTFDAVDYAKGIMGIDND